MAFKPDPVPVLNRLKLCMVFQSPNSTGQQLPFLWVTSKLCEILGIRFFLRGVSLKRKIPLFPRFDSRPLNRFRFLLLFQLYLLFPF